MTDTPKPEVVTEHDRVIDELARALEGNDTGTIEVARRAFMQSRQPLLRWIVDQEVAAEIGGETFAPSPEIQLVVDRDRELLDRLLSMDKAVLERSAVLHRERAVVRDAERPGSRPRAVKEKPLTEALISSAVDGIGRLHDFWENRAAAKIPQGDHYDALKPVIECALALRRTPDALTEAAKRDAAGVSYDLWCRIMDEFGPELCALAEDRTQEGRENWMAIAGRIGDAFISPSAKEIMQEMDQVLRVEEAGRRMARRKKS